MIIQLQDGDFRFENNLKDLDPSYKMDLDLCDCFERENPILYRRLFNTYGPSCSRHH